MKRKIITTSEGSHTLYVPELNEHYHSVHGAIAESFHVYIKNGFRQINLQEINILEIGFGTGLNVLLTLLENEQLNKKINYISIEKYPLSQKETEQLNYHTQLNIERELFLKLHNCDWNTFVPITANFRLKKIEIDVSNFEPYLNFDLIYFDAFAPDIQPRLWSSEVFTKIFNSMNKNAVFTTYSAKGSVRRTLESIGYIVERIPGPPKKRQMIRAIKP